MTTYLKRVDDLEKIALAFPGVEKCFAVQAGRELRVLVQPDKITDEQAYALANNLMSTTGSEPPRRSRSHGTAKEHQAAAATFPYRSG